MSIRTILSEIATNLQFEEGSHLRAALNFIIRQPEQAELFHLAINPTESQLVSGLNEDAIVQLEAQESTLFSILDLGIDPVRMLMKFTVPSSLETPELPEIETGFYVETATAEGTPLQFNFRIEDNILLIREGIDMDSDVQIRIKPSFLPKLIDGDANIPMALLTGKIRINNKRELFTLLSKLGLKL